MLSVRALYNGLKRETKAEYSRIGKSHNKDLELGWWPGKLDSSRSETSSSWTTLVYGFVALYIVSLNLTDSLQLFLVCLW